MTTATPRPWAILLCRFSDDTNDPSQTTVAALYAQWVAKYGSVTVSNWITASAASDARTILQLYEMFFTPAGAGTFNAVSYWDAMSHGRIDISGSRVFPCKLDMTSAEGAALAQMPGGSQYQNTIFQKAKAALSSQYGVNWKDFYGVAVSFQSPDYGAQGGTYDGGPGVYMDIRYLRSSGMASWGQEMGHAFGLDHSRQDGSDDDYRDPWDTMSTLAAFDATPDPDYGERGIGLNAWNMRGRQWLDETRVWKPRNRSPFCEQVALRPLHRRDLTGYLAAELPAIGTDSAYLVECRTQDGWDSNIPNPTVLVHRFQGPIGQFLGTHSYLKLGTKGQAALGVGDVLEIGSGPLVTVSVQDIDPADNLAFVYVSYATAALPKPTVSIGLAQSDPTCRIPPVESGEVRAVFSLANAPCGQGYKILWNVTGATPSLGSTTSGKSFTIVAPDPSVLVTLTVTLVFDDGTTVTGSYSFHSLSLAQASWRLFFCKLLQDLRTKPIPWWEWDPEKLRDIAQIYSRTELTQIAEHAKRALNAMIEIGQKAERYGRRDVTGEPPEGKSKRPR